MRIRDEVDVPNGWGIVNGSNDRERHLICYDFLRKHGLTPFRAASGAEWMRQWWTDHTFDSKPQFQILDHEEIEKLALQAKSEAASTGKKHHHGLLWYHIVNLVGRRKGWDALKIKRWIRKGKRISKDASDA